VEALFVRVTAVFLTHQAWLSFHKGKCLKVEEMVMFLRGGCQSDFSLQPANFVGMRSLHWENGHLSVGFVFCLGGSAVLRVVVCRPGPVSETCVLKVQAFVDSAPGKCSSGIGAACLDFASDLICAAVFLLWVSRRRLLSRPPASWLWSEVDAVWDWD
jgi:hypothetical protein